MDAYWDTFLSLTPEQQEWFLDMPFPGPEGVIANVENPPNKNGLAHALLGLTLAISTLVILVRAYARTWILKKVGVQDGRFT